MTYDELVWEPFNNPYWGEVATAGFMGRPVLVFKRTEPYGAEDSPYLVAYPENTGWGLDGDYDRGGMDLFKLCIRLLRLYPVQERHRHKVNHWWASRLARITPVGLDASDAKVRAVTAA
jgi:hypothetical protein